MKNNTHIVAFIRELSLLKLCTNKRGHVKQQDVSHLQRCPQLIRICTFPDCSLCVQMLQLKVVDLATWCVHGARLHNFTP